MGAASEDDPIDFAPDQRFVLAVNALTGDGGAAR
jgi:hypothetical protein